MTKICQTATLDHNKFSARNGDRLTVQMANANNQSIHEFPVENDAMI